MERQEYAWIIVDNTNIRLQDMVPYAQLALKYNYRIDIRDVKSPHGRNAQQCFEKCVHDVKQNKIQSLLALYEPVSVKQLRLFFDIVSARLVGGDTLSDFSVKGMGLHHNGRKIPISKLSQ